MKKLFTIGLVLVSFFFCLTVKAEEEHVLADDFAINIDKTFNVQDYRSESSAVQFYITVDSNDAEFNGTKFKVDNYGSYFYSINDGEFIEVSATLDYDTDKIVLPFTLLEEELKKSPEIKVSVYFKNKLTGKETSVSSKTVLIVEEKKELSDEKTGIVAKNKFDVPYGSYLKSFELTDETVLNNIKKANNIANVSVWDINIISADHDLKYYEDKYGYNEETNQGLIWGSDFVIPVPAKFNYQQSLDILGQFISKSDYKPFDTGIDTNTIEGKYTVTMFEAKYLSDYYFLLSDKVKFYWGDEDASNTSDVKDDTVESPKTGINDITLFLLSGLAIGTTAIIILKKNSKFKRI